MTADKDDPKGKPARDDDPPHDEAPDEKAPSKADQNALVADLAALDAKAKAAGTSLVGLLAKLAKDQTGAEL